MKQNNELIEEKVRIERIGNGEYKVSVINYRGKDYSCISNNVSAYDRVDAHNNNLLGDRYRGLGQTYLDALKSLYKECLSKNGVVTDKKKF